MMSGNGYIRHVKNTLLTAAACSALLLPSQVQAAAFYIQEQSVSGLGTAFAGAVADTPDASTIYYNPAGMTELDGVQITVGNHLIVPSAEFTDTGSTVNSGAATGNVFVPIQGGDGGDPFSAALVPNAYLAFPLSQDNRWWGGIGISAPFGLENEYNNDFFGRYNSTENSLQVIDIAPSMAWAATDWLSVGLGVNIQYAEAKLGNAIPSPATVGGPTAATDGHTDLSGDDTTVGFNAGLLLKPRAGTKVGLHYKQGISHTLEGRIINRVPFDVPGTGGTHVLVPNSSAELDLPNIASLGVSQKIGDKLTLLGSINWFEWSNFDDIPIQTPVGFSSVTQGYENTFAFAIGGRYQLTPQLQLKAGFQFDQTPTVDEHRSTRVPDGDRMWFAGGASYEVNDRITLDFSGVYVDVSKEDINLTETNGVTNVVTRTVGESEGSVGIVSAALRFKLY